jgi:hypothetical protein
LKHFTVELVSREEKFQTIARCAFHGTLPFGVPLVVFAILVGLTTGCVPIRYTTSPGAMGRIVDASTHAPVSGAEIVISRLTYPPDSPEMAFTNSRPPTVMSREAGQFSVPLERRLDFYFAPIDLFPRFGLLVIRCQGYETTCVPFWSHSIADLGEIDLKHQ